MHLFSTARKNLKENRSFYMLYLLSISFVITIFFAFTSFSLNTVMLEKISTNGRVESMCHTISLFLMAFVIFYMSYSNRFFLRRRTKELGIYALLGIRKSVILSLLTIENLLTCFAAFLMGIFFGAFLHKGIILGITKLLQLTIPYAAIPFWNKNAVWKTACFILLIAAVLALSNARFLIKTSLIDLVGFEKSAERKMKFHMLPAVIGFSTVLLGYGLALDILNGANSLWITVGFFPIAMLTVVLVLLGTVIFIASFLPYAVQESKRNKKKFYTETQIITSPNFIYRIRSNAATLIMLTLLSAATLTISSTIALTLYYPIAALSHIAPSELECRITSESDIAAIKQIVSRYSAENDVTFLQTTIYKVTSSAKQLPLEYSVGSAKGDTNDMNNEKILRSAGFECISYTDYISVLNSQGRQKVVKQLPVLKGNNCIFIKYQPSSGTHETGSIYPLQIGQKEIPVTVSAATLENSISFANSVGTLVVSEDLFHTITKNASPETRVLSINGNSIVNQEALYQELTTYLDNAPSNNSDLPQSVYLQGNSHRLHELLSLNSSTFLLIGFLVALFFIATGSILYFNNVTAVTDTKSDYFILRKIGYPDCKIKRIIQKQTRTFFNIPFLFGLMDCGFATLVFKTALMQNLLGNRLSLYLPVIIAIILTLVIYLIYYIITLHTCYKIVLTNKTLETSL